MAAEHQNSANKVPSALRAPSYSNKMTRIAPRTGSQLFHHLCMTQNASKNVIEVVGDAAGKGSDLFHSPCVLQAPVEATTLLLYRSAVNCVDECVKQHTQKDAFFGLEQYAFRTDYLQT
jgi:hypothetical protein